MDERSALDWFEKLKEQFGEKNLFLLIALVGALLLGFGLMVWFSFKPTKTATAQTAPVETDDDDAEDDDDADDDDDDDDADVPVNLKPTPKAVQQYNETSG